MNTSLDALARTISSSGDPELLFLEKRVSLSEALELRTLIPIRPLAEDMIDLAGQCEHFSPHEYLAAGAPYGSYGPFFLRASVAARLRGAQEPLQRELPGARLKLFDAYRPKSVQIYMRDFEHRRYARELGFDPDNLSKEQSAAAWQKVDAVWARPSDNPQLPTPHSTGAAVDLTIIDKDGNELPMGSRIDESSDRVLPSYYARRATHEEARYADNRELLRSVMEDAGFYRLSHEWWHFSYGDQFWALIHSLRMGTLVPAIYGEFHE
jgi:D-alanyl-D-alanine dipeptidase